MQLPSRNSETKALSNAIYPSVEFELRHYHDGANSSSLRSFAQRLLQKNLRFVLFNSPSFSTALIQRSFPLLWLLDNAPKKEMVVCELSVVQLCERAREFDGSVCGFDSAARLGPAAVHWCTQWLWVAMSVTFCQCVYAFECVCVSLNEYFCSSSDLARHHPEPGILGVPGEWHRPDHTSVSDSDIEFPSNHIGIFSPALTGTLGLL